MDVRWYKISDKKPEYGKPLAIAHSAKWKYDFAILSKINDQEYWIKIYDPEGLGYCLKQHTLDVLFWSYLPDI